MLLLAIDTATTVAAACVWRDGAVLAEGERRGAHVAQEVLVLCEELMDRAGIAPAELDGVVGGVGPGSFTGVRVGLATARGLGLALSVPVAGASTLGALRAGAGESSVACIDARRSEVFAESADLRASARTPAALVEHVPAGMLLVGDGAIRYRELFEAAGLSVPPDDDARHAPAARFLAGLAADDGFSTPAEPRYLRRPDAEEVFS
ncbi:MAG: tRNA (adenosine(37)-N6)-threonylcarbamoyltransferase complex dimerization subunit type 1 TsaB [Gaiellales bacterium]